MENQSEGNATAIKSKGKEK